MRPAGWEPLCMHGLAWEGQGDLIRMEKKMETTIYYLGFRV